MGSVSDISDNYFTIQGQAASTNGSSLGGTSNNSGGSSTSGTPTTCTALTPSVSPQGTSGAIGTLTIISPNGGECWQKGTTQNITWTNTDGVDKVSIMLKNQSGTASWIASNLPNNGSFSWLIPANQNYGKYTIEIIGYKTGVGSLTDVEDGFFTIY